LGDAQLTDLTEPFAIAIVARYSPPLWELAELLLFATAVVARQ